MQALLDFASSSSPSAAAARAALSRCCRITKPQGARVPDSRSPPKVWTHVTLLSPPNHNDRSFHSRSLEQVSNSGRARARNLEKNNQRANDSFGTPPSLPPVFSSVPPPSRSRGHHEQQRRRHLQCWWRGRGGDRQGRGRARAAAAATAAGGTCPVLLLLHVRPSFRQREAVLAVSDPAAGYARAHVFLSPSPVPEQGAIRRRARKRERDCALQNKQGAGAHPPLHAPNAAPE